VKLTSRMRRGVAGLAIAASAITLPAVALASTGSPARGTTARAAVPSTAAASRCVTSRLTGWLGIPGSGAAGSTYYQLEISNVSGSSCTLYGFPGVSAHGPGGGQLGSAAGRLGGYHERLVTLAPGQTAHAVLQITDVGNFSPSACHPATADFMRVFPPATYTALTVPFSFRACGRSGPVYLHVGPVEAGTGIPGYSN